MSPSGSEAASVGADCTAILAGRACLREEQSAKRVARERSLLRRTVIETSQSGIGNVIAFGSAVCRRQNRRGRGGSGNVGAQRRGIALRVAHGFAAGVG